MKRYPFSGIRNMRDLGGYPTRDGHETRWGRFIRCGVPVSATADELARLREMNFTTVIDLRRSDELEKVPCAFRGVEGFAYHHIEAYLAEGMPRDAGEMPILYFELTREMNSIRTVMRTIAASDGGVIFHCSAGKDRTGVVAALLLLLAGVAREDVLADYQVSHTYIREMIEREAALVKDFPMFLSYSKWEYMDEFLRLFFERFDSVEAYFEQLGLSPAETDAIRHKLLG